MVININQYSYESFLYKKSGNPVGGFSVSLFSKLESIIRYFFHLPIFGFTIKKFLFLCMEVILL